MLLMGEGGERNHVEMCWGETYTRCAQEGLCKHALEAPLLQGLDGPRLVLTCKTNGFRSASKLTEAPLLKGLLY